MKKMMVMKMEQLLVVVVMVVLVGAVSTYSSSPANRTACVLKGCECLFYRNRTDVIERISCFRLDRIERNVDEFGDDGSLVQVNKVLLRRCSLDARTVGIFAYMKINELNVSACALRGLNESFFDRLVEIKYLQIEYTTFVRATDDTENGEKRSAFAGAADKIRGLFMLYSDLGPLGSALANSRILEEDIGIQSMALVVEKRDSAGEVPGDVAWNKVDLGRLRRLVFLGLGLNLVSFSSRTLPALFANASELTRLSLNRNDIASLETGAFEQLGRLEELVLNANKLSVLAKPAFAGLARLTSLELAHNQIEFIDERAFEALVSLRSLKLDGNRIKQISTNTFGGLGALRSLSLAANQIFLIERDSFDALVELQSLNLNGNQLRDFAVFDRLFGRNGTAGDGQRTPRGRLSLNIGNQSSEAAFQFGEAAFDLAFNLTLDVTGLRQMSVSNQVFCPSTSNIVERDGGGNGSGIGGGVTLRLVVDLDQLLLFNPCLYRQAFQANLSLDLCINRRSFQINCNLLRYLAFNNVRLFNAQGKLVSHRECASSSEVVERFGVGGGVGGPDMMFGGPRLCPTELFACRLGGHESSISRDEFNNNGHQQGQPAKSPPANASAPSLGLKKLRVGGSLGNKTRPTWLLNFSMLLLFILQACKRA